MNMKTPATRREDLLTILHQFKRDRAQEHGVAEIGLFGSVARGEADEDSDVDIVFVTDSPNLFRTSRMRQELEEVMGCHVDIIRLRERMNPRLKARIQREARFV
jgi:predicted nucleotidyltransferase